MRDRHGLPCSLAARLRAYAADQAIAEDAAVVALLTQALDTRDARVAGGKARHRGTTQAERAAAARVAAQARWARKT